MVGGRRIEGESCVKRKWVEGAVLDQNVSKNDEEKSMRTEGKHQYS
jgi:hypothetical protein